MSHITTRQLCNIFTGCAPAELRDSLGKMRLSTAGSMFMQGMVPVPYEEEWGRRMTSSIRETMERKRLMPEKKLNRLRQYIAFMESEEERSLMQDRFPFEYVTNEQMGQLLHIVAMKKAYPDKSSPFLLDNFPILEEYANYAVCRRGLDTLVTAMKDYGYTFEELLGIVDQCTAIRDAGDIRSVTGGVPTYVIAKEIVERPLDSEPWEM